MADIYCDSVAGNDTTGDGSSGNPYETLNKGITEASASDTVYLVPQATVYDFVSDTLPANLTIKSTGSISQFGTNAIIDGGSTAVQWSTTEDVTIENVVIQNAYSSTGASPFKYYSTIGTWNITFNDCIIRETKNQLSTGARGGFVGNGNSVSNVSTRLNVYFNRCRISNFSDNGSSNSAFVHTNGIVYLYFRECTIHNDSSNTINSIVAHYSISNPDPEFRNTIISNEHATDLPLTKSYNGTADYASTLTNCCYYGTDATNIAGCTITSSVNADPLFLDAGNEDFRLKPASPCIDAGVIV